jgi:DNA-binding NarL/FixJ family response regulator
MDNRKRVLIIEDEGSISLFFKILATKKGLTVCGMAASGDEALILARREKPGLVLLDVGLPGGRDGIETAGLIKKELPETEIIFITGYDTDEIRNRALDLDPLGLLIKPVRTADFNSLIDSFNCLT